MANSDSRVPQNDPEFDQYIQNSTTYLLVTPTPPGSVPNYERLGMTVDQKDEWVQHRDDWIAVYPLYTDLNTRTKTITAQKNNIKAAFTTFASPRLTEMSVNENIIEADRTALRIPERDSEPTARGKIEVAPDVNITSLAGGFMKIRCRIDEDADRASMHPLADAIEMRYLIGTTPPATAEDAPNIFISKKALFTFEAGPENGGQTLYIFCRYVNFTNQANNGPWTTVHNGTIQA